MQSGDAELAALEDDIASDLAAIGITVTTEMLEKDPFNAAMSASHHAFVNEFWILPWRLPFR